MTAYDDLEHTQPYRPNERADSRVRVVPWQIWIVVAILAIDAAGHMANLFQRPIGAIWLAAIILCVVGLVRGWWWTYVAVVSVAAVSVLAYGFRMPFKAFMILVLLGLIVSARSFFEKPSAADRQTSSPAI